MVRKYRQSTENPSIPIYWPELGAALNLATATFTVTTKNLATKVVTSPACTVTGYATFQGTAPYQYNAVLTWTAGAFAAMSGVYAVTVIATIAGRDQELDADIVIEVEA
jgi:hypothetical protein